MGRNKIYKDIPDKKTLIELVNNGMSQTALAIKFGCSRQNMGRILVGHVPPKKLKPIKKSKYEKGIGRVWNNINKTDTCWLWKGKLCNGFGRVSFLGKSTYPHILFYKLVHGNYGKNVYLKHRCGVKHCCNPDHLYLSDRRHDEKDFEPYKKGNESTQEQLDNIIKDIPYSG
jgi:hypothetical protein